MNTENILVLIDDQEFEAEVDFNYTPGQEAITHLPPEYCQEGFSEEYEISKLMIIIEKDNKKERHDISFLIESLQENIEEQLKEVRESYYEN